LAQGIQFVSVHPSVYFQKMNAMWIAATLVALLPVAAQTEDSGCLLQKQTAGHEHLSTGATKSAMHQGGEISSSQEHWAILELSEYSSQGSWDWWSDGDIYAHVVLHPSGFEYKSEVQYNQNQGNLNLNIYVPTSVGTISVSLYDHHEWFSHDLVGTASFNPSTDCGAGEICSFSMHFRSADTVVEHVAWATTRWFTGASVRPQAEACNKKGIWVHYEEESREKSVYKLASVQADTVDKAIFFAQTGSVFPESLHGIHWMDQRGTSLYKGPYPEDPTYRQTCELAADEVFVSFGEAAWNPHTKCVTGVRQYGGGPLSGHWSWLDQGGVSSNQWDDGAGWNMKYDFCFRDEAMTFIDVLIRVSLSRAVADTLGLESLFPPHVEVTLPTWLNGVSMKKTVWGWDRLTTIGPSWLRTLIRSVFESHVIQAVFGMGTGLGGDYPFLTGGLECHYPLLQIVDGNGNRTKYWQDYMTYINNGTTCEAADFTNAYYCPINRAAGTVVMGRLQEF